MELLIAVVLLASLALLASRFGHDSRDHFPSKEFDLAAHGMTWTDLAADLGPERAAGAASAWSRQHAGFAGTAADRPPTIGLPKPGSIGAFASRWGRLTTTRRTPSATPRTRTGLNSRRAS